MDFKSYLIGSLQGNLHMITSTLGDFSDADMFVRPCPGANHAAWQLGHITLSEAGTHAMLSPQHAFEMPAGFKELYNMAAHVKDGAAAFAPFNTKDQLVDLYTKVRGATVACVEALSTEQLDTPTPEKYQGWAKSFGLLAAMQAAHGMMHLGQFQVIRRKLGKPILF